MIAAVKAGKSLWDIFALSSGVLRSPAVILDENLVVAALNTTGFLSCRENPALHTLRSLGRMTRLQRIQFLQDSHYSVHKSAPWICPENYGLPRSCNINLLHQHRNHGILSLFEHEIPLNQGHSQLLEQFAQLISEHYNNHAEYSSSQRKPYLLSLLTALEGRTLSPGMAATVERDCGWHPADTLQMVVLSSLDPASESGYLRYFITYFENRLPHSVCFLYQGKLVCILEPASASDPLSFLLQHVIADMPRGYSAAAGVSLPFQGFRALSFFYQQGVLALSRCTPACPVCCFEEQAVDFLLWGAVEPAALPYALHPGIRMLWTFDQAHHTEYCRTLMVWLMQERNMTAAAKSLYIHRNTLLYRLQKLQQLLPCDWDDPHVREYAFISLRLLLRPPVKSLSCDSNETSL